MASCSAVTSSIFCAGKAVCCEVRSTFTTGAFKPLGVQLVVVLGYAFSMRYATIITASEENLFVSGVVAALLGMAAAVMAVLYRLQRQVAFKFEYAHCRDTDFAVLAGVRSVQACIGTAIVRLVQGALVVSLAVSGCIVEREVVKWYSVLHEAVTWQHIATKVAGLQEVLIVFVWMACVFVPCGLLCMRWSNSPTTFSATAEHKRQHTRFHSCIVKIQLQGQAPQTVQVSEEAIADTGAGESYASRGMLQWLGCKFTAIRRQRMHNADGSAMAGISGSTNASFSFPSSYSPGKMYTEVFKAIDNNDAPTILGTGFWSRHRAVFDMPERCIRLTNDEGEITDTIPFHCASTDAVAAVSHDAVDTPIRKGEAVTVQMDTGPLQYGIVHSDSDSASRKHRCKVRLNSGKIVRTVAHKLTVGYDWTAGAPVRAAHDLILPANAGCVVQPTVHAPVSTMHATMKLILHPEVSNIKRSVEQHGDMMADVKYHAG